jgi:hypothetical protein
MKIYLLGFLVFGSYLIGFSQTKYPWKKEILLGGVLPIGKEISGTYNFGASAEFGLAKGITKSISFKPFVNYSFFYHKPSDISREVLHFINLGINLNYLFILSKEVNMYAGPSLSIGYYMDDLVFKKDAVPYNMQKRNAIITDFLLSYDVRCGVTYRNYLLEIAYRPYKSVPHIGDYVTGKFENNGDLYQYYSVNASKFNLSMLSINIGIKF